MDKEWKPVTKTDLNDKKWKNTEYADKNIIAIDYVKDMAIPDMIRLDMVVMVYCTQGNARLAINGTSHDLNKNDLLLCKPNTLLDNNFLSADFSSSCVCISSKLVEKLFTVSIFDWDVVHFLNQSPVLHLDEEEDNMFKRYYELLRLKLKQRNRFHHVEIMESLLQAFVYEVSNIIDRFLTIEPTGVRSADIIFKKFINLIFYSYPKNRSVSYYSDQLNITPKYLAAVCMKVSEKKPSTIINLFVIEDIKFLLKKTHKSIKEISDELEFPNISFFGRYVKKHLGVGPKKFRDNSLKGII